MSFVSSGDYADLGGHSASGLATPEMLSDLNKALLAGNAINDPGASAGGGFPLRVESLERTLKNTTFSAEHLRFWKAIPKKTATNTVEEHNEVSSYGNGLEGFVGEDQTPEEDDSTLARKYAVVKFIGTTRKVSHVMSVVTPAHGNVIAQQTVFGTLEILRAVERSLFYADSALSSLQFDGFEKLITSNSPAANIIDMRGQPLDEDTIQDAALSISDGPNYGTPTHIHSNPKVKSDFMKAFFPRGRLEIDKGTDDAMVGLNVRGVTTAAGDLTWESNTFVNDGGGVSAAAGDSVKRPATPTVTAAATTPVDALGKFTADDAGSYFYKIVAHNDFGRSAAVDVGGGAIAIAAGDKMTAGITPGSAVAVKWYSLYRTKKGGADGTERLIARIPNTAGAGALTINDYNNTLPYSSSVFLWQQNEECMAWKQLAPLIKIPLATVGPSIRWMQLLYGVPVLYAPGRATLIKNVGRSPNFKGQP